jgi:hypothetical protein
VRRRPHQLLPEPLHADRGGDRRLRKSSAPALL